MIDILICTIDDGLMNVSQVLMSQNTDVHYVVSVQHTRPIDEMSEAWRRNLDELRSRTDVVVTTLEGRGLSRNRNNALRHATADIIVIADDDCRYTPEAIDAIINAYYDRPLADIICFRAADYASNLFSKPYPQHATTYEEACRQGYYPASVEITLNRKALERARLQFDERFGLGATYPASEETILLCDAHRAGLRAFTVPQIIVRTNPATTGSRFLDDPRLQVTKGVVFRYCHGLVGAHRRTLLEGLHYLIRRRINPWPIMKNMLRGIWTSLS